MADVADLTQFRRTLDLSMTEVRAQNAPYLLRRCLTHPDHGAVAWAFIDARWDEIVERIAGVSVARMLEGIRSVTDTALADEIDHALRTRPLAVGQRLLDQHLERMHVQVAAAAAVRAGLS